MSTNTISKGWLPAGTTENDLPDSAFAWRSYAFDRGEAPKTGNRKLPFRGPDGTVDEDGWRAAWSRAHQDGTDFSGGPSREDTIKVLLAHKPAGVHVEEDTGKSARELPPPHPASTSAAAPPPTPALQYKTISFKLGQTDGLEPDCFQGYAAAAGNVDETGDVIAQGAFANTLADFLSGGMICWQHDWTEPIGKPLEVREDGYGLFIKARISDTARGRDALTLLRDGVVSKLSIGYQPLGYRILSDAEGRQMLGADAYDAAVRDLPWYQDGIRMLTDIKLYEVSIVSIPANARATVTGVKESGAPLAGLPLSDHFSAVHAAVGDYLSRVQSLTALRKKEGRMLSAANREKLEQMKDALAEHLQMLGDMLDAAKPAADPGDADADGDTDGDTDAGKGATLHAGPEQKDADPTAPTGPTSEETKAAAQRELVRFLAQEARLLGVDVEVAA